MNTLAYCVHYKCVEAVLHNNHDFILAKVTDRNFITDNPFRWTPLHYTVAFDNYEITRKILDLDNSDLDIDDKYRRTPLSIAALRGNAKILQLLLSQGADVFKGLPLCYAATRGNKECVLTLIQSDCNIDEVDEISPHLKYALKYTPLIIAIKENHPEVVNLLLENGASTNFGAHKIMTPLHHACQGGNLEIVQSLLGKTTELDSRCQFDDVPLDIALRNDKFDIVKYLLNAGASVNCFGKLGETPLHTSVGCGNIEYVKEIVKFKANMNIQNIDGATPLYLCSYRNTINEDIFEFLIKSGADVNLKCNRSWSPLHLCCAVGNLKCVRLILGQATADVNVVTMDNITPLYIAAFKGYTEICKELLDHGAYINIKINKFKDLCSWYPFDISEKDMKVGYSAEDIAAEKEHHDVVALQSHYKNIYPPKNIENHEMIHLIQSNTLELDYYAKFSPLDADVLGWTWLHYAAESGNYNLVKYCISKMVDVNVADKYGRTPLTLAAANGNLDIVKLLTENGTKANLGSAVFYTIENYQIECLKYLIDENDIVAVDRRKRSPVIYAAFKNNLTVMELLLQTLDVTHKDEDGETALHHACNYSQELVELLIRNNADVNAQNNCLETPIAAAAVAKSCEVIETLLKHGADPKITDRFQQTPLHYLAECGTVACVQEIIKYSPDFNIINVKDSDSYTPFLLSMSNDDIDVFRLLLKCGADLSDALLGGWSALHICACYDKLAIAEELIKHNIDVNALSQDGVSALYIAASRGHQNFVKMLIENGALLDTPIMCLKDWRQEPHIANKLPRMERATPLIAAIWNKHLEIVKILHTAGASIDVKMEGHMNALRLAKKSHYAIFCYLKEQKNMKSTCAENSVNFKL